MTICSLFPHQGNTESCKKFMVELWPLSTSLIPNFNSYTASCFTAVKKHAFLSSFLILQNPSCVQGDLCYSNVTINNYYKGLKEKHLLSFERPPWVGPIHDEVGTSLLQIHAGMTIIIIMKHKDVILRNYKFLCRNQKGLCLWKKKKIVYLQRLNDDFFQRKYYRSQRVNKTCLTRL